MFITQDGLSFTLRYITLHYKFLRRPK